MANKTKQWSAGDLFIPGLGMGLAVYYLYTVRGLAPLAQLYGGGLSLICIALFLAAVIMVIRHRKNDSAGGFKKLNSLAAVHKKFIVMTVLTALFIVIIPIIGYPLASVLFVASTTIFLKYGNPLRVMKVSVIVTLVGFVLFIIFLNVDLPLDAVTEKLRGVL